MSGAPAECSSENPAIKRLGAQAFRATLDAGLGGGVVLDVRTDAEHQACCLAAPHLHIPMDRFSAADFIAKNGADKPVYILCAAGRRAAMVAQTLVSGGHRNVTVVDGGLTACEGDGLAVLRSGKAMPLERQALVVAGLAIMGSVVLGWAFASAFYWLGFAVGCGLIFAGVTGRCLFCERLKNAPWNRDGAMEKSSCCGGGKCGS